jgi:hypothetical protein
MEQAPIVWLSPFEELPVMCEVDMETCYDDHRECYFERINVRLAWDMSYISAWPQEITV